MKITKAVITAAARNQRTLPLQTLVDRDGDQKPLLNIIVEEAIGAGVEDICVVVAPGDEDAYRQAAGGHAGRLSFIAQNEPRGYGHAVSCAREFVGEESFLHMIGDHVYISGNTKSCAEQIIEVARRESCAVSGVQPTRENLLPYFGAVGGQRLKGKSGLYQIERVVEKPTPTEAEQTLMIAGLRSGHYLCFFGMHVLTPTAMEILGTHVAAHRGDANIQLSPVLDQLAKRERYLALETRGRRYPVDVRYGLLTAQLALALSGRDRDEVLTGLCELLAQREMSGAADE
ncbi:MAG: UTP--glucose-1-phosphate uridylyltransferase [Pyrinomonadaceae bacterium]|nr:UTP--glucose-1-phosphate uridylyltransferase [Pyrinomonadaceae bacterium]